MRTLDPRFLSLCLMPLVAAACLLISPDAHSEDHGAKLLVQRLDGDGEVTETLASMLNPETYEVVSDLAFTPRRAPGGDGIWIDLGYPVLRKLSFDLVLDVSEHGGSVKPIVESYQALTRPAAGEKRPPTCLVVWGTGLRFQGLLTDVKARYTQFLPDGTPVRCVMSLGFKEHTPAEEQLKRAPRH